MAQQFNAWHVTLALGVDRRRQNMSACSTILVYEASIHEAVSHTLVAMVILFSEFSLGDV